MASVTTAPRMGSLTPAMAPGSQPITYTTTTTSQAVPVTTTHYQANSTASGYNTYPAQSGTVMTYPAGTTTAYPMSTSGTTYPATGNVTTYPATGGVTTYPATGGISTSPAPGGVTTTTTYPAASPTYQGGSTTTTYPVTTTGGTMYPGQVSKYPAPTSTTYPAIISNTLGGTTYPAVSNTHQVTSLPAYTSMHSHQVYHPENTEYVLPSRSLRGGMRPLYDMSQVRTYEAAPVFHSAPYVVDGGETHLTREVNEVSVHKSTSMVSEDVAHRKKHSSKNTQGKKKFCC